MQSTSINKEVGYLGLYEQIIEVFYEKRMVLQEKGNVTLFMNPKKSVATKFSQYDDPKLRDNTKDELLGNLKSAGVDIHVVKGNKVGDLQDISHKY